MSGHVAAFRGRGKLTLMPELNTSSFSTKPAPAKPASKVAVIGAASVLTLVLELARVAVRHFWGIELPF